MSKTKSKRLLSWLLTLAMVFTMLPASALADEAEPAGDIVDVPVVKVIEGFTDIAENAEITQYAGEAAPELPEALNATIRDQEDTEPVAVAWTCEPEFDPDAPDTYVFTAALADEAAYTLAEGVSMPAVAVTVEEAPAEEPVDQAVYANGADIYVSDSGHDDEGTGENQGDGSQAHPYKTISKAYEAVTTGGTIHVLNNIEVSATITFGNDKKVTIVGDGNNSSTTVTRAESLGKSSTTEPVFKITAGDVTFQNITLDGNAQWSDAANLKDRTATNVSQSQFLYVGVHDPKDNAGAVSVTLGDGAIIQNHCRTVSSTTEFGGAVYVGGAKTTLTMKTGSAIQNCAFLGKYADGGAVSAWEKANFTIEGGELTGNTAPAGGGAR